MGFANVRHSNYLFYKLRKGVAVPFESFSKYCFSSLEKAPHLSLCNHCSILLCRTVKFAVVIEQGFSQYVPQKPGRPRTHSEFGEVKTIFIIKVKHFLKSQHF